MWDFPRSRFVHSLKFDNNFFFGLRPGWPLQSAGPLPPPGVRRKLLCILEEEEEEEESQIRIASDHHLPYREAIDNMPAKSLLRNSIRISQGALFLLTTLSFSLWTQAATAGVPSKANWGYSVAKGHGPSARKGASTVKVLGANQVSRIIHNVEERGALGSAHDAQLHEFWESMENLQGSIPNWCCWWWTCNRYSRLSKEYLRPHQSYSSQLWLWHLEIFIAVVSKKVKMVLILLQCWSQRFCSIQDQMTYSTCST